MPDDGAGGVCGPGLSNNLRCVPAQALTPRPRASHMYAARHRAA